MFQFETSTFLREFGLDGEDALFGGTDIGDGAIGVEGHAVDADFTMVAGTLLLVDIVLIDAVIDDIPLVLAGHLDDAVVRRAIDLGTRLLHQHDAVLSHGDGAHGRGGGAVGHVVVG